MKREDRVLVWHQDNLKNYHQARISQVQAKMAIELLYLEK